MTAQFITIAIVVATYAWAAIVFWRAHKEAKRQRFNLDRMARQSAADWFKQHGYRGWRT